MGSTKTYGEKQSRGRAGWAGTIILDRTSSHGIFHQTPKDSEGYNMKRRQDLPRTKNERPSSSKTSVWGLNSIRQVFNEMDTYVVYIQDISQSLSCIEAKHKTAQTKNLWGFLDRKKNSLRTFLLHIECSEQRVQLHRITFLHSGNSFLT